MDFEKLKFEKISRVTIIIEPIEPPPFTPIITEYRGIQITQTSLNNFTFQYGGFTYAYLDYYTCTSKIDSLLYVPPIEPPPPSQLFIEECDTFDPKLWVTEYGTPEVINGEWLFDAPAVVRSQRSDLFSYGHYEITFRTEGVRKPSGRSVLYSTFFYLGEAEPYNELDIPECMGSMDPTQLSISTYRDGRANSDYRYFNSPIQFEDTGKHTWGFDWLPTALNFFIDGIQIYQWISDKVAKPPLFFYPMFKPEQVAGFKVFVSKISYYPTLYSTGGGI